MAAQIVLPAGVTAASSGDNLALNKQVFSDSEQGGNTANKANDGNTSTRWCANDAQIGHWWMVDLGENYNIAGTKVNWESDKAYQYKIEVSNDNSTWSLAADRRSNTASAQVSSDDFTAMGRYVRITVTGLTNGAWASISEFEVRPGKEDRNNLALNKQVSSDSEQGGNTANKANDGNKSTRWCANDPQTGHWWMVDLGENYNIAGTKVIWETGFTYQYKIEVSKDKSTWWLVADRRSNTAPAIVNSDDFTARGRYVRITVTGLTNGVWASISEFEVRPGTPLKPVSDTADSDADGINNELETNGYISSNGRVQAWDGNPVTSYYRTDSSSWSTTADPYSDQMKVTGLGMDMNVSTPARTDPWIAAYPQIKVSMNSFDVIPLGTISDKNGNSDSSTYTNAVANKDEQTHKGSISVKHGGQFKIGTSGLEKTFTYEVAMGYEGSRNWGTTSTVTNSAAKTQVWETAKTTDIARAARVKLNLQYTNYGSAPAKDVLPTFNLKLGNKIISTIKPNASTYTAPLLTTTGTQKTFGPIVVEKDSNSQDIVLSLDELKAIQLGAPLILEPVAVQASAIRWDSSQSTWKPIGDWNVYNPQIEGKTATVIFEAANGVNKEYKLAAHSSFYNPNVTIRDAIIHTVGGEVREDGIYIGGKKVTDQWSYYFSNLSDVLTQLDRLTQEGKGLLDVELVAGTRVTIHEPSAKPEPVINWVQYSSDFKRIYASVAHGDYPIGSVTADVMVNGSVQQISLQLDESGAFYYNAAPLDSAAALSYSAKITVVDARGAYRATKMIESGSKEGLSYVPLPSPVTLLPDSATKNLTTGQYDASLQNYPDAEAFVLQVESDRWSAKEVKVKTGDIESQLGTNDIRYRTWTLKITDKNGSVYSKTGTKDNLNVPSLQAWGIPDNAIKKIEVLGDNKYYNIEAYSDENFGGSVWTGDSLDCDSRNCNNQISSLRFTAVNSAGTDWTAQNIDVFFLTAAQESMNNQGTRLNTSATGVWETSVSNRGIPNDAISMIRSNSDFPMSVILFENSNFEGKARTCFLPPRGKVSLKEMGFENQMSSFKITNLLKGTSYYRGGHNSPVISKTVIVPRNGQSLPISWYISDTSDRRLNGETTDAHIRVKLLGYYANDKGYKFTKFNQLRTIEGLANVNTQIGTNVRTAKAYLVQVINRGISSDDVAVTINGVTHHLGTSDLNATAPQMSQLEGLYSPMISDLMIVPAGSDPAILNVQTQISDWKNSYIADGQTKIIIEVQGYFSDDSSLVFHPVFQKWENEPYKRWYQKINTDPNKHPQAYLIQASYRHPDRTNVDIAYKIGWIFMKINDMPAEAKASGFGGSVYSSSLFGYDNDAYTENDDFLLLENPTINSTTTVYGFFY
nr:discoidin domain-containing protein [Paenibacillus sp. SYP-B3998]